MEERKGVITMKGSPVTLVGPDIKEGERAPDFTVIDGNLNEVRLGDFAGKYKVISVTPSLDTPVCDLQARRFNHEAATMPESVAVLNISMDLPFAISRFCAAADIGKVTVCSDHRDASFGTAYGVLIKELRLLARSVFILDKDNVVRYKEIVTEQTDHPDYDGALAALDKLIGLARAA